MQKVTKEFLNEQIKEQAFFRVDNTTTTICILTLKNGAVIVDKSACLNIEDFDMEQGKKIALENAGSQLWELYGFSRLESKLLEDKAVKILTDDITGATVDVGKEPLNES